MVGLCCSFPAATSSGKGELSCAPCFALLPDLLQPGRHVSTPRLGCTSVPPEEGLPPCWRRFSSSSSGKLQTSGYVAVSLWHRNKLKPILLLSLSSEITLYAAHSCPKSPSFLSIYRFHAQDISASKEILLSKECSIIWKDRGTPALNLCCGRGRGEYYICQNSNWTKRTEKHLHDAEPKKVF